MATWRAEGEGVAEVRREELISSGLSEDDGGGLPALIEPADVARSSSAAGPRAEDHPGVWVYLEKDGPCRRGEQAVLSQGAIVRGDLALDTLASGQHDCARRASEDEARRLRGGLDARTLLVTLRGGDVGSGGGAMRTRRLWRDSVESSAEVAFGDWPVSRPRTASWCMEHMDLRGGGPQDYHRAFRTGISLAKSDWGVDVHGLIRLGRWRRQGDLRRVGHVTSLACFELLLRHAQLVEYIYVQDETPRRPRRRAEEAREAPGCWMRRRSSPAPTDTLGRRWSLPLCPTMSKVERDATVMKQVRKAREERRVLGKGSEQPSLQKWARAVVVAEAARQPPWRRGQRWRGRRKAP